MRTLYIRIIAVTLVIMIISSVIAFVATNVYYHVVLKPENDQKITSIARDVASIYQENNHGDLAHYLQNMAELGYSFYAIDESGSRMHYGATFDDTQLDEEDVKHVLHGDTYHGIAEYPWKLFITGFFSNELKNTVGVPLNVDGKNTALFVRADTQRQFGEMRMFLAVLLVLLLLVSFVLVPLSTRFIVRPVRALTGATKKVAAGNYHLQLPIKRRDEIGELARNFSQMSQSLEQMEEKRQEFVSNVSHEIQSPLTSIQGFSQTIRTEDLTREERDYYLEIIEKESNRLSILSKQLLTLSMLDKETEGPEEASFSLSDQLKEVISTTRWQWQEKELALDLALDHVMIEGDPKLLYQVWMNVLTNAIHYTDPGGTINVQVNPKKNEVEVVISDTGIGIEENQIPHLFDRFFKVDKSRDRAVKSTGLGLSIVKKILELHRGTIMVESTPGEGTTFRMVLPKHG